VLCAPAHAQMSMPESLTAPPPKAVNGLAPDDPLPPTARPLGEDALLDRVIAVVNDEAITQYDLNQSRVRTLRQLNEAKVPVPPADVLDKQVLERLINERALLEYAKESGIKIDDTTVERTILRVAQENKMTPDQLRAALDHDHVPYAQYREDIRREITLQRVREREVDQKIFVTEAEVDNYLANQAAQAGGDSEYMVSHVLVSVPEQATPDQLEQRRKRAENALAQIKAGTDFGQIAASYSDAPDALQGGSLGWRTPARLPPIFVEALQGMKKGDVAGVIRSPSGFHILKLVDVRSLNASTVVDQTHVKHILIKVNENVSEAEAKARIDRIHDAIVAGAKFDDQAKVNSEDASSAKGGDLGWLSPGDTVPDFEKAYTKLKINELSDPVRTVFGWHLIEVTERRQQDVTKDRQRAQARQALQQRKSEEQFAEFVRSTRDRAYVEYKVDDK
jgi:peptidyl-prolyl cis-trans isomerase SurA